MISGDHILELAGRLAKNSSLGDEEARCRSAISRAYYAAFHFAKAFLQEFEITVSTGPSGHGAVFRCLFNCGFATAQSAANMLDDLRRVRNHADYDLNLAGFESCDAAKFHVEQASKIKADLQVCLQNRAAIRAGLAAWKANPASR
jgi:uncharacterized protein (UPF0332 family)